MAIQINNIEDAQKLLTDYEASGNASTRTVDRLRSELRFATDPTTSADDVSRFQSNAIRFANDIATQWNQGYEAEKSNLGAMAANLGNITDVSGLSPEEAQKVLSHGEVATQQTAYQNALDDFNKKYSAFGFEAYGGANLQKNANGYIEQVDESGKVVSAALPGVVEKLNAQNSAPAPVAAPTATPAPTPSATSQAFQPTEYSTSNDLSELQKTVMGTDGSLKANDDFINGVFSAFHNRDATAAELAAYSGKTVSDVRTEIIGGAQAAGLPTVAPGTIALQTGVLTPQEAEAQGLQKVLRPDQLSAFTEDQVVRDNLGGIYLKDGAVTQEQLAGVAAGKSGTDLIGRPSSPTADADAALVERGASSPSAGELLSDFFGEGGSTTQVMDTIANSTTSYITKAIASLDVQLDAIGGAQAAAQTNLNTLVGRITDMSFNNTREQELERVMEEQGIQEKRDKLSEVLSQIENEKAKLNLGLIQEENKLAPLSIIGTRQNALREQAMATIGVLSSVAQIYQGDLDFAESIVDATMNAINADRTEQLNTLSFLVGLAKDDIVELNADERAVLAARTDIITQAMEDSQENSKMVFDLIKENPEAAVFGRVSLTDSPALALSKMAPYMAIQNEADKAANNTQVIDLGGQKLLIDKATGQPIRAYNEVLTPGSEGTYKDITRDDGSLIRVFLDDTGRPTGEEVTIMTADQSKTLQEFNTGVADAISEMADPESEVTWQSARDSLHAKYPDVPMDIIDSQLAGGVTIGQSKDWGNLKEFLTDYPTLQREADYWKKQGDSDAEIIRFFEDKYKPNFNEVGADTYSGARTAMTEISTSYPVGSDGGQCGRFVNQNTGFKMGDSYESKMAYVDESITVPRSGDVFVMEYDWTGHTGLVGDVTEYLSDGSFNFYAYDSNWSLDERVQKHIMNSKQISGFARPTYA